MSTAGSRHHRVQGERTRVVALGSCVASSRGRRTSPQPRPNPETMRAQSWVSAGMYWPLSVVGERLWGRAGWKRKVGGSLQPKNILRAVITDRDTHWVLTAYRPFTALAHRHLPTPQGGRCSHTHFTDVETEAQRTGKTCPSLHLGKHGSGQALPLSPSRAKVHFYIEKTCPSYEQCN